MRTADLHNPGGETLDEIFQHAANRGGTLAMVSSGPLLDGELVMLEGVPLRVIRRAGEIDLTPTQLDVWARSARRRGMLYLMEAAD